METALTVLIYTLALVIGFPLLLTVCATLVWLLIIIIIVFIDALRT